VTAAQTFLSPYCPKDPYGCGQGLSMTALCPDQSIFSIPATLGHSRDHLRGHLGVLWGSFRTSRPKSPALCLEGGPRRG